MAQTHKVILQKIGIYAANAIKRLISAGFWAMVLSMVGAYNVTRGIELAFGQAYGMICAGLFCMLLAYLLIKGMSNE